MNKILIVWNVLLSALLAFLFFSNNSGEPTNSTSDNIESIETSDSTSTEMPTGLAKVVFVNNDSLFEHLEMYKDLQDELLAEKIKLENRYKREVEKLEKEYLDLREKAPFMTQAQGEAAQNQLLQKQQDLGRMEQDLTLKLGKKEAELTGEIKKTIENYLTSIQEEYGYDFVLGKSSMGGIHFANKGQDITQVVLAGLNKEYLAKKEVKKTDSKEK